MGTREDAISAIRWEEQHRYHEYRPGRYESNPYMRAASAASLIAPDTDVHVADGVFVARGGATVIVRDVEASAVIYCVGGGASITILGDVGLGAIIRCYGGGASIAIHGEVHPTASVVASGGGAKVLMQ